MSCSRASSTDAERAGPQKTPLLVAREQGLVRTPPILMPGVQVVTTASPPLLRRARCRAVLTTAGDPHAVVRHQRHQRGAAHTGRNAGSPCLLVHTNKRAAQRRLQAHASAVAAAATWLAASLQLLCQRRVQPRRGQMGYRVASVAVKYAKVVDCVKGGLRAANGIWAPHGCIPPSSAMQCTTARGPDFQPRRATRCAHGAARKLQQPWVHRVRVLHV
eukprot:361322-Chlamydomonas_euryale.AAC.6